MRIERISMAAELPVLLSEVRGFLKISHRDEDAMIAAHVRAAAEACERFTGRKLISQQWQLTLNDWGADVVELPLSPILSVDKIEYWTAGAFLEITAVNYLLDRTSYQARILPAPTYNWPGPEREVEGIKITVSAGFGTGHNDVPHDIRLGLLHWVAGAYDAGEIADNQAVIMAEKLWQPYRRVAL
ncbi:MAG: hypothetical protein COA81_01395 [Alphaproteobacteria bacterium]|nr:MAG: hypothetical protein COA81_01395 [Alphaproteobacteria bacterium]